MQEKKVTELAEIFWYITLSFQLIESVIAVPVSFFKITFAIDMVICGWVAFQNYRIVLKKQKEFFETILGANFFLKVAFIFGGAYILYDMISLLYTGDKSYVLYKYVVCAEMIFYGEMYLICCMFTKDTLIKRIRKITLCIAVAGLIVASFSIVNYFFQIIPIYYLRRLSTAHDYNQFSTLIIVGYVCLVSLYKSGKNLWGNVLFVIYSIIAISTVYLSGSRRNVIVGFFVVLFVLLVMLYDTARNNKGKLVTFIISWCLVICGSVATCTTMNHVFDNRYIKFEEKIENEKETEESDIEEELKVENSINETMASVTNGQAMNARKLIWSVALNAYKEYTHVEKIFGKGGSYSTDLYDLQETREVMNKKYDTAIMHRHWMYPHNFLITDMLNGGIVKLLLSIGCMVSLMLTALFLLRRNLYFWFWGALIGIPYLNAMISSPHGCVADKIFWIALIIGILLCVYAKQNPREGCKE